MKVMQDFLSYYILIPTGLDIFIVSLSQSKNL